MNDEQKIQLFVCGPSNAKCRCGCPDGPCEHVWDGAMVELDEWRCVSVTCSRCGITAVSHSLWVGP